MEGNRYNHSGGIGEEDGTLEPNVMRQAKNYIGQGRKKYHPNRFVANGYRKKNYHADYASDRNSDEFLNDYLNKKIKMDPAGMSLGVRWEDVLALGMIPEQRNNNNIHPDFQYKNQIIDWSSPEAPSPAPVPDIIQAESISPEFISECNFIFNTIYLKITNTITNINYILEINSGDEVWKTNSQYFPNFDKFYDILSSSLNNENEYVQSKIQPCDDKIKVILTHEGLYMFEIEIIMPKEKDKIDIMEEKIEQLMIDNLHLKEQNEKIIKDRKKINDLCDFINYYMTGKNEKCPRIRERTMNGGLRDVVPCVIPNPNGRGDGCACKSSLYSGETHGIFKSYPEYWENFKKTKNWEI